MAVRQGAAVQRAASQVAIGFASAHTLCPLSTKTLPLLCMCWLQTGLRIVGCVGKQRSGGSSIEEYAAICYAILGSISILRRCLSAGSDPLLMEGAPVMTTRTQVDRGLPADVRECVYQAARDDRGSVRFQDPVEDGAGGVDPGYTERALP